MSTFPKSASESSRRKHFQSANSLNLNALTSRQKFHADKIVYHLFVTARKLAMRIASFNSFATKKVTVFLVAAVRCEASLDPSRFKKGGSRSIYAHFRIHQSPACRLPARRILKKATGGNFATAPAQSPRYCTPEACPDLQHEAGPLIRRACVTGDLPRVPDTASAHA
jgi:hypothetical protein